MRSEEVNLDAKLMWNDFSFIPYISMESNIKLSFSNHFKILNIVKGMIQRRVAALVDTEVAEKLAEAVKTNVNPRLQQFKQKMVSMGYTHYEIEWTVQDNALRVTFKPKR
ncbi:unnamed protein product [Strongylus vulgaris]|uniref:Uncharacterized protein n=1 Tax=Strongylus vulgaris TaxID=40348 RepID=A0A3P7J8Z4_STRVU|nr:unnamed protein product [Strongylus vulgaris]